MKTRMAFFSLLALTVLPLRMGYAKSLAEWLIKPGGSPPVITHWFASEELHHGDIWKIYLEANDPDGDMRKFVCVFDQVGYGPYSADYVVIKRQHREKLRGYLTFFSSAGAGLWLPEWTQLKLKVYIQDKDGNTSNKVIFPLVLSRGAKQGPPPPPFVSGQLDKLGTITVELINPEWNGNKERIPWGIIFH